MTKKLILLFSLFSLVVQAQPFNKLKMDSLFTLIEHHHRGMGSISIFEKGQEVYQNTIGYVTAFICAGSFCGAWF